MTRSVYNGALVDRYCCSVGVGVGCVCREGVEPKCVYAIKMRLPCLAPRTRARDRVSHRQATWRAGGGGQGRGECCRGEGERGSNGKGRGSARRCRVHISIFARVPDPSAVELYRSAWFHSLGQRAVTVAGERFRRWAALNTARN